MEKKSSPPLYLQCASPKIFFFALIWLLVLLIIGTLAQRTMGLHDAQIKYFSSWFTTFYLLPVPGGRLVMSVIFVNLLCKLLFASPWHWKRSGIIITHLGALFLLGGGFITAYFSVEGSMVIPEGGKERFFQDYHLLEIAFITPGEKENDVIAFSGSKVKPGTVIQDSDFPAVLKVKKVINNCKIVMRSQTPSDDLRGLASQYELIETPSDKEGRNNPGMIYSISGLDEVNNGTYIASLSHPEYKTLMMGDKPYQIHLRRLTYELPFTIELLDFQKHVHPGTAMASSFKSIVNVIRGDIPQRVEIYMNHPLRDEGYTFYQSSYMQQAGQEATVLAVVKNYGMLFPYISSIVMCIGLLIHLLILLPKLIQPPKPKATIAGANT
ncbi:MAG: cytochrome c biogenesis protein ResB [Planctomycetes bacterium]|nr:cytochrome c biogenesis protein ResB [Planctomycetota bacterium]